VTIHLFAKKGSRLARRKALIGFLFSLPAIASLLFFFVVPFCMGIKYSFQQSISVPEFVGLEHYKSLLESGTFRLAALNTGKFIFLAVPLLMVFSLLVSLLLSRRNLKGTQFFRAAFNLPLALPIASVTLFFQLLFHDNGLVNSFLSFFGLMEMDWLESNSFALLVILYIWKNCGYDIILFIAALSTVPQDVYEASELDGAGDFMKLAKITFPLITPYLFFILIISIINAFKSFREAFILFGNYPDKSVYMLQHFINNNITSLNYNRVFVGAIFVFVIIFTLVLGLFVARERWGESL
jgi:multiple sugar transport system permease protein